MSECVTNLVSLKGNGLNVRTHVTYMPAATTTNRCLATCKICQKPHEIYAFGNLMKLLALEGLIVKTYRKDTTKCNTVAILLNKQLKYSHPSACKGIDLEFDIRNIRRRSSKEVIQAIFGDIHEAQDSKIPVVSVFPKFSPQVYTNASIYPVQAGKTPVDHSEKHVQNIFSHV
uniref:Uncharacterized protein n=1 Tax=Glossina austeni TaxID=7395 RepID=A0A1A9VF08_GLOAU